MLVLLTLWTFSSSLSSASPFLTSFRMSAYVALHWALIRSAFGSAFFLRRLGAFFLFSFSFARFFFFFVFCFHSISWSSFGAIREGFSSWVCSTPGSATAASGAFAVGTPSFQPVSRLVSAESALFFLGSLAGGKSPQKFVPSSLSFLASGTTPSGHR